MNHIDTHEMIERLRVKFAAPEYGFLDQVRNATGSSRVTRTADAIAMSLWPSRGLELHGFEVKVSRTDWLKEKKDPSKADVIQKYCDRWWLAIGHKDIVQEGELPPTWGLIIPHGRGLSIHKAAPALETKDLGRSFLAAVMRRAAEKVENKNARELYQARREGRDEVKKEVQGEIDNLEKIIKEFEEASGINIRRAWALGRIGEAVKIISDGHMSGVRYWLENLDNNAKEIIKRTEPAIKEFDKVIASKEAGAPRISGSSTHAT